MKTINVTQPFNFAVQGIQIIRIESGVQVVEDECAQVALNAGWAEHVVEAAKASTPETTTAVKPEPKAHAPKANKALRAPGNK